MTDTSGARAAAGFESTFPGVAAAAVASRHHRFIHGCRAFAAKWIPGQLYVLLMYAVVVSFTHDMSAPILKSGFAWMTIFVLLAFLGACIDFLRVSHPGINNSTEVNVLFAVTVLYVVLLVAAFAITGVLMIMSGGSGTLFKVVVGFANMFCNTTFLVLTIVTMVTVAIAQTLNSRTAMRGIGMVPDTGY